MSGNEIIRLNLGSSDCQPPNDLGWLNVDCRKMPGVDIVMDLNTLPYPWADCSVDEIHASHVLEHLNNPMAVVIELRRVLKPGGRLTIIVPNATGYMAHAAAHYSYFSQQWFSDLSSGNRDAQNDCGQLFSNAKLTLHLFHHALRITPMIDRLARLVEWWGNRSRMRQLFWEISGVLVPGEIRFSATKPLTCPMPLMHIVKEPP